MHHTQLRRKVQYQRFNPISSYGAMPRKGQKYGNNAQETGVSPMLAAQDIPGYRDEQLPLPEELNQVIDSYYN